MKTTAFAASRTAHRGPLPGSLIALGLTLAGGACVNKAGDGATGSNHAGDLGAIALAITAVPADVQCVRVTVTGNQAVVRSFDVVPGLAASLTLIGLPLGNATVYEETFNAPCASVMANTPATWVSQQLESVVLVSGQQVSLTIVLRRPSGLSVTTDFEDGQCAVDTDCAAASCAGGAALTHHCQQNQCVVVTRLCAPFACMGSSCATSCTSAADCAAGAVCTGGLCKAANGGACTAVNQCASGNCVDGVCCNSACTGACQACNVAGASGTCSPVAAGTDPKNACAQQAPATCGTDGFCDGAGACRLTVAGTICAAASCTGSTATLASACNGAGTCVAGGTHSCSPGVCAGTTCSTGCTTDASCGAATCSGTNLVTPRCQSGLCTSQSTTCAPFVCASGACKSSCTGDVDCVPSNTCHGGVCVACGASGQVCCATGCNAGLSCTAGICASAASLRISPTTGAAFGIVGVGTKSATVTFTVTNPATIASPFSASLAGADAGQFALVPGGCVGAASLAAGASCALGVQFTPSATGNRSATLGIGSPVVASAPVAGTGMSGQDIGAVGVAGSFSQAGGVVTVNGGGADVGGNADAFYFVFEDLAGDGTITARVTSMAGGDGANVKAGVMMRDPGADGLGANDVNGFTVIKPSGGQQKFQLRVTSAGTTTSLGTAASTNPWVRLIRAGNTLTSQHSADGQTWTNLGSSNTFALPTTVKVGLAVTSHITTALATVKFDNVTITSQGGSGGAGGQGGSGGQGGQVTDAGRGPDVGADAGQPLTGNGCAGGACLNPQCVALGVPAAVGSLATIGFEPQPGYIPNDVIVPTFDDVPDRAIPATNPDGTHNPAFDVYGAGQWSQKLVQYLDANSLHADFFINTNNWCGDVTMAPDCLATLASILQSHNPGNHTVHHVHMGGNTPPVNGIPDSCGGAMSGVTCDQEVSGVETVVDMVSHGGRPHLTRFRAPYGEPFQVSGPGLAQVQAVLAKYAVQVGWSMDSGDSVCSSTTAPCFTGQRIATAVEQLIGTAPGQGQRWGVVLMHGTYPWTYDAAKLLLDPKSGYLRVHGFRVGTVEDAICWKYGKHSWEIVQQLSGQARAPN